MEELKSKEKNFNKIKYLKQVLFTPVWFMFVFYKNLLLPIDNKYYINSLT